jgi:hypothetical protein
MTFFENRAVYEIMWKTTVQPDRPQMAIYHGARALHSELNKAKVTLITLNTYLVVHGYNGCSKRSQYLAYTYISRLIPLSER